MTFKSFLIEATDESKLTHLEHAEDHHINAGHKGFMHAFDTLHQTHQMLTGKKSTATISTKYDGSPSIVFGTNPDNGKFFVASKSAFNVSPKLNYTVADIEKNHGHAPGLVSKLKAALQHLPKVAPKEGVYQGDFMYHKDDRDVKTDDMHHHFKPNTITYSVPKDSEEGQKVKDAKIGVVVHTAYKGSSLQDMKAHYNADTFHFGEHKDVHLINPSVDKSKIKYTPKQQESFLNHMQKALDVANKIKNYKHLEGHTDALKTYINSTVKDNTKPSLEGYKSHVGGLYQRKAAALKTAAGKQRHLEAGQQHLAHIDKHENNFKSTLELHKHLQNAKNVLVNALASHTAFGHSVNGQKVKPEGHVVVVNNRPTKLVDRSEFSRLNFASRGT